MVQACNSFEELLAALRLYVKLDNDLRAGCDIDPADWAECHQMAIAAIAKARGVMVAPYASQAGPRQP